MQELATEKFLLKEVVPKLLKAGFHVSTVILRLSDDCNSSIGSAICKRAEAIDASAIVLTRASKSALVKFFTGSVTRFTLDHSLRPVLLC